MSRESSLRVNDDPRGYQLEIARRAQEGNVIAVADTGSGKTLISVLLLKSVVSRSRATAAATGKQQRISFFVVNKVPLVFQQHAYIANNSDISVEPICGAMDVDNFDAERWNAIFREREVIVLTGQILFDIFQCAFLKIQDCDLIIFDECHHATKEHNYRKIMTDFYDRLGDDDEKPKIFGMTASPPKDKGTADFSAQQLEKTLSAQIYTAAYEEVVQYTQRPKERSVWFHGNPILIIKPEISHPQYLEQTFLYETHASSCPSALRTLCEGSKHLRSAFNTYLYAQNELGPWCSAKIWDYAFDGIDEEAYPGQHNTTKGLEKLRDLKEAMRLVPSIPRLQLDKELTVVTEKLRTLLDILRQSSREGFCGILFVERRPTAHVIHNFLNECKRRFPGGKDQGGLDLDFINSAVITGHGSKTDAMQLKMQLRDQRRVLNGFRKGAFNLLVATDVAEEGLDIRRCKLVIRFDNKNTLISFIQSRGRARDPASDYVIMQRYEDDDFLSRIRFKEQQMRDWCGQLPEDRVFRPDPNFEEDTTDPECLESELLELALVENEFFVPSTGARLSFSSAIDRLYRYCASLPGDAYTRFAPEFQENHVGSLLRPRYQYLLTLPPNVPVTEFQSDVFASKRLAKRSAAFKACKRLLEIGLLNDRVLPFRKKALEDDDGGSDSEPDVDNMGGANGEAGVATDQANVLSYPIHQPDIWSHKIILPEVDPTSAVARVKLYGTILTLRPADTEGQTPSSTTSPNEHRRLCLLTKERLPEFDPIELFFDGTSRFVNLQVVQQPVDLEAPLVHELYRYETSLFKNLFRGREINIGSPETGMRHIIVPLLRGSQPVRVNDELKDLIDWSEIRSAPTMTTSSGEASRSGIPHDRLSWDGIRDAVLFEYGESSRFYFPVVLRGDLNPCSLIPHSVSDKGTRESGQEGVMTFATLYSEKRGREIHDLAQPLVEVERVQRWQDHLQPGTRQLRATRRSAASFLVPELCHIGPISASVLRSSSWVVSVLDRLDGLLKARECLVNLGLEGVETSLILEALTSSVAGYKMNYQRLELLGDTFLKFVMSIHLFIRYPLENEGQLTVKRRNRISNSWLYKRAKKRRLDRFVVRKPPVNKHFFATSPPAASPSLELSNHLGEQFDISSQHQNGEQTAGGDSATSDDQDTIAERQEAARVAWEKENVWPISQKNMADMVESILGAAFLSGGLELGLAATQKLVCSLEGIKSWSDFPLAYVESQKERDAIVSGSSGSLSSSGFSTSLDPQSLSSGVMGDLSKVEKTIGYKFKNRRLLEEALTHASWLRPRTPCYQRLEFLGDSILDMLVAHHWVNRYPISGPGMIHEIKSASVNNQTLGVLCIQLGLHRHILQASSSLSNDINGAVEMIQEAEEEANGELKGEYWSEFVITKVLGDVLESMLGAVYVDSNWNFDTVKGVFDRTILPVLEKHISMETLKRHPIAELFRRLAAAGCQQARLRNLTSGVELDVDSGDDVGEGGEWPTESTSSGEELDTDNDDDIESPLKSTPLTPLSPSLSTNPASPTLTPASSSSTSPELPRTPPGYLHQPQQQKTTWKSYKIAEGLDVLDDQPTREPQPQECALMLHGIPALRVTNTQVRVARREVAKEGLVLLDSDPTWLELYCNCPSRTKKAKSAKE